LMAGRAELAMRTRRCIVTGADLPEGRLLRFVADAQGRVLPDVAAKLPGRGLWVSAARAAIAQAAAKRLFARAAKAPVEAAADLAERAEALLVRRALDTLGLARRAGELALGFDKIDRALRSASPPAVVIDAADAAPDGRRKLQAAALASGRAPYSVGCFSAGELGLALGLPNVVHAALKPGRLAERFVFDAGRLQGFRPLRPWAWNGFSGQRNRDAGSIPAV